MKPVRFITQSYLFIGFEFIFVLKHIFCLPKKPQQLFFQMASLQVSSVLIYCTMWSSYLFSASSCFPRFSWSRFFRVQVFQCLSFLRSRFFRVQAQGLSPGFKSSHKSLAFCKCIFFYIRFFKIVNSEPCFYTKILERNLVNDLLPCNSFYTPGLLCHTCSTFRNNALVKFCSTL